MMQSIRKFISKYHRLTESFVKLKLYIKFPHRLITDIKVFIWRYHIFGQSNKCDFRWSNGNRDIRY